jgi:hypothetical protein
MSVCFGEMEETLPVGQKIKQVKKDLLLWLQKNQEQYLWFLNKRKNYQIKR